MFVLSFLLAVPLSKTFAGYDPALYAMTLKGFYIYTLSFIFSGMAILGSSFFTALNNGPVSAIIAFCRTVVYQVGCVITLPLLWGVDGIWWSIVAAEALAATTTSLFLIGLRKRYNY